jgi:hypothetical protein
LSLSNCLSDFRPTVHNGRRQAGDGALCCPIRSDCRVTSMLHSRDDDTKWCSFVVAVPLLLLSAKRPMVKGDGSRRSVGGY